MTNKGSTHNKDSRRRPEQTHSAAIRQDLKAFADSELSVVRRWLIGRHVAGCAECRKEIMELNRVSVEMRRLPQPTPRPELRARILATLPDTPPAPSRPRFAFQPAGMSRRLSLAGAMCTLALVGLFAFARYRTSHGDTATMPPATSNDRMETDTIASLAPKQPLLTQNETASPDQPSSFRPATDAASPVVAMTDETSREADRILFEERQAELAEAIRHARKLSAQKQAATHTTGDRSVAPTVDHDRNLQLAVADITTARERLNGLVQEVGAIVASPNVSIESGSALPGGAPGALERAFDPMAGSIAATVTVAVPAAQVAHFQTSLREIGTPSALQAEPRSGTLANRTIVDGMMPKTHRIAVTRPDSVESKPILGADRTANGASNLPMDSRMTNYQVFTIRLRPAK